MGALCSYASELRADELQSVQPCELPLRIQVALSEDGEPVVSPEWIAARIDVANMIYAPEGLTFGVRDFIYNPELPQHVDTRLQRHELGEFIEPGAINLIIVQRLKDIDFRKQLRNGVHWKIKGDSTPKWPMVPISLDRPRFCEQFVPEAPRMCRHRPHLVIMAQRAREDVLAHELGHFLGNREHSQTRGNVMSYARDFADIPFFNKRQRRLMKHAIGCFLESGDIQLGPEPPTYANSWQPSTF